MTATDADNGASAKALALAKWVLKKGIEGVPPLASAEALAAEYAADRSYRTSAERVRALIRWEAAKNFGSGFATGLGTLAMLPVAVPAAIGASWILQARLAGAIVVLHGHSLREDRIRTLMLLAIVGDTAKDMVKTAGVMVGKRLTANVIGRVPGRVLIRINQAVGMRLLTKAGQTGAVNLIRAIPIAGGVVGGSLDAAGCVAVGRLADRLFRGEDVPRPATRRTVRPRSRKKPAPGRRAAARRTSSSAKRKSPSPRNSVSKHR